MDTAAIGQFLGKSKVGVVASVRKDGSPQPTPVWYRYDGESIVIWTDRNRAWVRNLSRDGRVAFSVQDEAPPFAALVLRGRAQVIDRLDEPGLAAAREISGRYIGDDDLDGYLEAWWPQLHSFVTITPEVVTAWRRGY